MAHPRRRSTDLPRRQHLGLRVLALLIVLGLLAIVGVIFHNTQDVDDTSSVVVQIQKERARNTLTSCENENRQNGAIRRFVQQSIPKEQVTPEIEAYLKDPSAFSKQQIARSEVLSYLDRLQRTFPHRDCKAELRKRVKGSGEQ